MAKTNNPAVLAKLAQRLMLQIIGNDEPDLGKALHLNFCRDRDGEIYVEITIFSAAESLGNGNFSVQIFEVDSIKKVTMFETLITGYLQGEIPALDVYTRTRSRDFV